MPSNMHIPIVLMNFILIFWPLPLHINVSFFYHLRHSYTNVNPILFSSLAKPCTLLFPSCHPYNSFTSWFIWTYYHFDKKVGGNCKTGKDEEYIFVKKTYMCLKQRHIVMVQYIFRHSYIILCCHRSHTAKVIKKMLWLIFWVSLCRWLNSTNEPAYELNSCTYHKQTNKQTPGFKAVFSSNESFFGIFQEDIPLATYNTTSTQLTTCSANSHMFSTTLPASCYHPTSMQQNLQCYQTPSLVSNDRDRSCSWNNALLLF
jgi:hypothetical protein